MSVQEERRARRRQEEKRVGRPLNEDTRHGIVVVVLFVVAGLSLLSFFDFAGPLGRQIDLLEGMMIGWARYLAPLVLIIFGAALVMKRQSVLQGATYIGVLLLAFSLTGLLHLFFPVESALEEAGLGRGGGYLGYGVAWPLLKVMGRAASFIILLALLLIGLLVTLNISLQLLAERSSRLGAFARSLTRLFGRFRPHQETSHEEPEPTFAGRAVADADDQPTGKQEKLLERPAPDVRLSSYALPDVPQVRRTKTDLPLNLLNESSSKATSGDIKANSERIRKTLENFGIQVEMGEVYVGPTVTQYTLKPAEGVKLAQIITLANDLALALAAHPIRIEAPIPGKSLVGVEVPNQTTALVSLRGILASDAYKHKKSSLTIALGRDVAGHSVVTRLDTMPHLLIAGATGSGKSVCINTAIISLLFQNQPKDLKFILVDPKRVELTAYNDIPHLITPVITDVKKTVNALKWAVAEMDRRFRIFEDANTRNIAAYNALPGIEPLPYIVVIIDELADLMASSANEVEGAIVRIAQMARAVGMHLIVATQRPSVDVITGLIKANITSRIAFSVASVVDSRTILDTSGAEKLLGRGDMLYVSAELSKPRRLQGAFVSDEEIQRVVSHLHDQAEPEYQEAVVDKQTGGAVGEDGSAEDDLYDEAKRVILQAGKASASLLQRRLRVGYARAARLLDILEENGVIGPLHGAHPREVLVRDEGAPQDFGPDNLPEASAAEQGQEDFGEPPRDEEKEEEQY